jgi:D-alanine-D-alanine ligase
MSKSFGSVAVLMGGWSAEREVSLKSGNAVLAALKRQAIQATGIDAGRDVVQQLQQGRFDRVFIVLHGRGGEDGTVQGALELLGMPYTGSGVLASALGMDKWRSKLVWQAAGLPTPECVVLDAQSNFSAVEGRLGLPLFVKPANEGSSIGVTKVSDPDGTRAAYESALRFDRLVLAERYVGGGEYTVPILAGVALPAIRIVPAGEFYDYEAKYFRDDTRYLCPCGLGDRQEHELRSLALRAFEVLGGRGWGRVDILLDNDGHPHLLEANTVPGMTDHSLVPMAAKQAGIDFDALCVRILQTTLEARHASV